MAKEKEIIKDEDLKQVKGGLKNWISWGGKIVQCNADCYGQKSDRCQVKNSGCCNYNR